MIGATRSMSAGGIFERPRFVIKKFTNNPIMEEQQKREQPNSQNVFSHTGSTPKNNNFQQQPPKLIIDPIPLNKPCTHQRNEKNIFDVQNLDENGRELEGVVIINNHEGPRYKPDGTLIPHSLVGKPEWYAAVTNPNDTSRHDTETMTEKRRITISTPSSSAAMWRKRKTKGSNIDGENILNKQEALSRLAATEQRIQESRLKESKAPVPIGGDDPFVHQMHQLKNYESTSKKWDEISTRLANAAHRPVQATLLCSSTPLYRQKVEFTSAIESAKSPGLILGNKFWEVSLRDKFVDFSKQNNVASSIGSRQKQDEPIIQTLITSSPEANNPRNYSSQTKEESHKNSDIVSHTINNQQIKTSQHIDEVESMNRSFFRELSYTKGTRVAVAFRKDFPIIKHPNLSTATTVLPSITESTQASQTELNPTYLSAYQKNSSLIFDSSELNPRRSIQYASISSLQSISFEKTPHYVSASNIDPDGLVVKGQSQLQREKMAVINMSENTLFSCNSISPIKAKSSQNASNRRLRNPPSLNLQDPTLLKPNEVSDAILSRQDTGAYIKATPMNRNIKTASSFSHTPLSSQEALPIQLRKHQYTHQPSNPSLFGS